LCHSFFLSAKAIKPKLCIDCKHIKYDFFTGKKFGKCRLFPQIEEDNKYYLVTGQDKKNTDYYYCSTVRNNNNMCGTEGKCFDKK
jgi:hypothetical protein